MMPTEIAVPSIGRDRHWWQMWSALERGKAGVLAVLIPLTAAAWLLTIAHAGVLGDRRNAGVSMAAPSESSGSAHLSHFGHDALGEAAALADSGMAGANWSLVGFLIFLAAWAVMMAAMMFPGLAPMLLLVRTVAEHRRARGRAGHTTAIFAFGYLIIWTAVGVVTSFLVLGLTRTGGTISPIERADWSSLGLGAALVVAGLYQFTPFKQVCLDHCRSPMVFVMQRWREGPRGALQMGIGHGLYCLGCCWALFTVLVAAGIMSLAWMLLLTLVDFAEKALPAGSHISKAVGIALLVAGVIVAVGFVHLPGAV